MIGRITGEGVSKLTFRTYYSEKVDLGEVLVVEDEDDSSRLFIRVVDILYGSDAHDDGWMERTAGNILSMERTGEEYQLHDRDRRLYQLGVAVPLGYDRNGNIHKAKTLPAHLSPVSRPSEFDYQFLKSTAGDLKVGFFRSGERIIEIPVGIWGRDLPQHVGIFATTGMGKSNLMRVLSASIMCSQKYGLLLMDPHGEYLRGPSPIEGGLQDVDGHHDNLVVFSSHPKMGESRLVLSSMEIEPADLAEVYNISEPQMEFCLAVRDLFGNGWFMKINDSTTEEMENEFGKRYHISTISAVQRKVNALFSRDIVENRKEMVLANSVIDALSRAKVVVVDTSYMDSREEMLVLSVLARRVFSHAKRMYSLDEEQFQNMPPILITVEEAQRVLGKDKGTVFSKIAREGRKFKVGLCAISQQPKLINPEVISQFNTLFILGLSDKRDRDILKESAKQDISGLSKEIQTLGLGEGLVASPGLPFAVPFKAHHFAAVYKDRKKNKKSAKLDEGFF
ncbi:MAG TPA: ATP-binding protein [Euryarchaeota archaeon]|nr:ATP-binding protein [Euryarchaeota archaeon]